MTGMGVIEKNDLLSMWKLSYRVIYSRMLSEYEYMSRSETHIVWSWLYTLGNRPIEMFDRAPLFLCQKGRSSGDGQVEVGFARQ